MFFYERSSSDWPSLYPSSVLSAGEVLHWLALGDESVAVALPCPAHDLIELAGSLSLECQQRHRNLENLVRKNPTLLVMSLNQFWLSHHRGPNTVAELIEHSETAVPIALAGVGLDAARSSKSFKKKQQAKIRFRLDNFSKAKSNRKIKRALCKFVQIFCDADKGKLKEWIENLVGPAIRGDGFEAGTNLRNDRLANWFSTDRVNGIQGLFQTWMAKHKLESEFESRLRDSKLVSMKGLAYGASHEINNPLANIATRAETLLAIENDHEKRHKLSVMYEQAMRAHEMISDMMLFAHPPASDFQSTDLKDLVKNVVAEMKTELEQNELTVLVREYPDVVPIEIDPTQFSMALKAMIRNSMEAMLGKGEVRIRLFRASQSEIGISMIDNGPGVEQAVAENIFDPFFSGREAGRGLGFGLSKTWRIMELHSGSITCDQNYRDGAKFELRFPIKQQAAKPTVVNRTSERAA